MTVLEEFYESYLHYTVAQRLFEDRCRQLIGFKGGVDERQALVDETLRLAICVSDNVDDTEALIPDTLSYLNSVKADPDISQAVTLVANNLKEDRARANSYSNFVTYRRIGNRTRKPRRPQIANPFVPLVDDSPVEAIVIPPKNPEEIISMTMDGDGGDPVPGEGNEEDPESSEDTESGEDSSTVGESASDTAFVGDSEWELEGGRSPLALESERIAEQQSTLDETDEME